MAISDRFITLFTQFVNDYENPGYLSYILPFSKDHQFQEIKKLLHFLLKTIINGKDTLDEASIIYELNNTFLEHGHTNKNILGCWLQFKSAYQDKDPQKSINLQTICLPEQQLPSKHFINALIQENAAIKEKFQRETEIYQKDIESHRKYISECEQNIKKLTEENTQLKLKEIRLQKIHTQMEQVEPALLSLSGFFKSSKDDVLQKIPSPPSHDVPQSSTRIPGPPPPPPLLKPLEKKPSQQTVTETKPKPVSNLPGDLMGELIKKLRQHAVKGDSHQQKLGSALRKRRIAINGGENSPPSSPDL